MIWKNFPNYRILNLECLILIKSQGEEGDRKEKIINNQKKHFNMPTREKTNKNNSIIIRD